MARYKFVDMSPRLLPVVLEEQLVPGSFAHAVHHLVDVLDLSGFDAHYRNDDTGAPAHAPSMLLKAVLLAYSQGIISSRSIERACRNNVQFIAISGDAKPHFTTIADFISRSRDAIASVFAQVLSILGNEGLIGRVRHRRSLRLSALPPSMGGVFAIGCVNATNVLPIRTSRPASPIPCTTNSARRSKAVCSRSMIL